jgi:hypothetical protein
MKKTTLIIVILALLLSACTPPPEPTPTPTSTPVPTNTPTNTPEPTATNTLEPTATPREVVSDEWRERFVDFMEERSARASETLECKTTWDEPEELKMVCKYIGDGFSSVLLPFIAFSVTKGFGDLLKEAGARDYLPDGLIVKVIASDKNGVFSIMSITPLELLLKLMDEKITTQIEWEQEAEIIK